MLTLSLWPCLLLLWERRRRRLLAAGEVRWWLLSRLLSCCCCTDLTLIQSEAEADRAAGRKTPLRALCSSVSLSLPVSAARLYGMPFM